MAAFEYIALDSVGNRQTGNLEADSSRQARQVLREKGLMPLKVYPFSSKSNKTKLSSWFKAKVSILELATFTRQLAALINAAMPLEEALLAMAEQQQKRKIKKVLLTMRTKILEGFTFHQSIEEFPEVFPKMYRATVAAGEHAGYLDKVLLQLADYTENKMKHEQKVQQAMIYPVILTVVSICILSFLLGFVVPDIIKVFGDSGQDLPSITLFIVGLSEGLQNYWQVIILSLFVLTFIINRLLEKPNIKIYWHQIILKLPIVGNFSLTANAEKFSGTLSLLLQSSVPLVDALDIAAQVINNLVIKKAVLRAAKNVSEGESLHSSLISTNVFPPLMLHMISCGEATGELDNMLAKVSEMQKSELNSTINVLLSLLEPFMLIVMGGVVMTIVLAILLPIFNMNDLVG